MVPLLNDAVGVAAFGATAFGADGAQLASMTSTKSDRGHNAELRTVWPYLDPRAF